MGRQHTTQSQKPKQQQHQQTGKGVRNKTQEWKVDSWALHTHAHKRYLLFMVAKRSNQRKGSPIELATRVPTNNMLRGMLHTDEPLGHCNKRHAAVT